MLQTVYYLVHRDTEQRFRYYRSLAGARIAQHSRNAHLGFRNRIERREGRDGREREIYLLATGDTVEGTWQIESAEILILEEAPLQTGVRTDEKV